MVVNLRSGFPCARTYFEQTASRWKNVYSDSGVYAGIYRARREAVLALVDELRLPNGSHVLDIGCGPGVTSVALGRRGFVVYAVDPVAKMITLTSAEADRSGVSPAVIPAAADVHNLPFPDATFDLVLAVGVLEWVDSLRPAMREIKRVVRPGAHVILTTDNRWAVHNVLDPRSDPLFMPFLRPLRRLVDRFRGGPGLRPQLHSIPQFDAAATSSGFRKLRGRTLGFGPFTFLRIPLLPDSLGWALHRRLQALADRGIPILSSGGQVYLFLASRISALLLGALFGGFVLMGWGTARGELAAVPDVVLPNKGVRLSQSATP